MIKNKNDIHKNRNNKNNFSQNSNNKTCIYEGNTYLNFKKYYQKKNVNERIANNSKKDNRIKHISLLNELLKLNKKGNKHNIISIKKNFNNNNSQDINITKQNISQINYENKQ